MGKMGKMVQISTVRFNQVKRSMHESCQCIRSEFLKYFILVCVYFIVIGNFLQIIYLVTLCFRKYLGDKVGIYFAYMEYYVWWLIMPTLLGVIALLYGAYNRDANATRYGGVCILLSRVPAARNYSHIAVISFMTFFTSALFAWDFFIALPHVCDPFHVLLTELYQLIY